MARQPKTRQPKAKFNPRCITCGTEYRRFTKGDRLVTMKGCDC